MIEMLLITTLSGILSGLVIIKYRCKIGLHDWEVKFQGIWKENKEFDCVCKRCPAREVRVFNKKGKKIITKRY
jgi:hypothetical protein